MLIAIHLKCDTFSTGRLSYMQILNVTYLKCDTFSTNQISCMNVLKDNNRSNAPYEILKLTSDSECVTLLPINSKQTRFKTKSLNRLSLSASFFP